MANSDVELPPYNFAKQQKDEAKSPPQNSKSHDNLFGRNIKRLFRFWQRVDASKDDVNRIIQHLSSDSNSAKQQATGEQQQDNFTAQTTATLASQLQPSSNAQYHQNHPMFAVDRGNEFLFEDNDSDMEENEAVDPLSGLHTVLLTWLYNSNSADTFWQDLEERTGQRRETLTYGILGASIVFMIFNNLSEVVCMVVGVVYPLLCTYEMLRLDPEDVPAPLFRHWIYYWCVFGTMTGFDFLGRLIIGFLPFYNMIKASILLLAAIPDLGLSSTFFFYLVRPVATFGILLLKRYAVL